MELVLLTLAAAGSLLAAALGAACLRRLSRREERPEEKTEETPEETAAERDLTESILNLLSYQAGTGKEEG